jgi:hypothetical protein
VLSTLQEEQEVSEVEGRMIACACGLRRGGWESDGGRRGVTANGDDHGERESAHGRP